LNRRWCGAVLTMSHRLPGGILSGKPEGVALVGADDNVEFVDHPLMPRSGGTKHTRLRRRRSRLSPVDFSNLDIRLDDAEIAEQLHYPHTNW